MSNNTAISQATNKMPLFYQQLSALSKEAHRDWYIESQAGYQFAAGTNSLFIAAVEFARAAKEYPIVFAQGAEDTVYPLVVLGTKNSQNCFLDEDSGKWKASYIPAYVRRYPFILANTGGNGSEQYTVCIDEKFVGFNQHKQGEALFDEAGEQSEFLKRLIGFLRDYQTHTQFTEQFCLRLQELELLEPMQASISLAGGEEYTLGGFLCVNRAAIKNLSANSLKSLIKNDYLELVYAHLMSLDNMQQLFNDAVKG